MRRTRLKRLVFNQEVQPEIFVNGTMVELFVEGKNVVVKQKKGIERQRFSEE